MSARDELRAELLDNHGYCVNCGEDAEDCECAFEEFIDATLAAGYTKHRTITTTDEVDALPNLSVVMTCHGDAETIHRDVTNAAYHFLVLYGPAIVLHEPEAAK